MGARVYWRGEAVERKVVTAAKSAIDETTRYAAAIASVNHPWSNESGDLESNIHNEPAHWQGTQIVGKFGSARYTTFYGLFLERRRPWMRPAADITFRTLAKRIRARV